MKSWLANLLVFIGGLIISGFTFRWLGLCWMVGMQYPLMRFTKQ